MRDLPLWKFLVRRRIAVANVGLVVVLLLGVGYLALFVQRVDLFRQTFAVKVAMPSAGGLQPNNDVTFRGLRVGKVRSIDFTDTGILAVVEIDATKHIPVGGTVSVQRLSAAGEQFLDIRPDSNGGPYLHDGSMIDAAHVTIPVTVQSVLADVSGMINGLNPDRLQVIVDELDKALGGGPDRMRNMVSGISHAMAGLDSLLPQTTRLIESLEIIGNTTSLAQPDLETLTKDTGTLFSQLTAADNEVKRFLDLGPGQLATLGGVVRDTTDPATNLLTNFIAITRAARLRTPAMAALFPAMRSFTAILGLPAHDGEFHTLAEFYPRPSCDYPTIPLAPENLTDGRTRLYNYCGVANPAIQIRGSANAPRPNIADNTAGPPPGVSGNELSAPLAPVPGH